MRDKRAHILGVVDRNSTRAESLAHRFRLPYWGTDLSASWISQAQCASIGTPPTSHAEITMRLLCQGLHVLCEKPLATLVSDAEAMVACAKAQQRVLAVVHNFQFASAMRRARRLLEEGALGDLVSIYACQFSNPSRRLPSWHPELRGGLFYDEAPHLLYLLRSFLGDLRPQNVTCRVDHKRTPPNVVQLSSVFGHPSLWAQLLMNFSSPISEWQLILLGSKQTVAVDIFRDISILLPNDQIHGSPDILRTSFRGIRDHLLGTLRSGIGHLSGRLLYGNETVVSRFIDAVCAGGPLLGISGSDGLAVVRALDEILGSASL